MTEPRFMPPAERRRGMAGPPGAPRNYTVAGVHGSGATEQLSRLSARRAFVDTKQVFMQVLAQIDRNDAGVEWLRKQVRSAQMPEDLWLLRSAVFDALRSDPHNGPRLRETLRRSLDGVLPGTYMASGFSTL